MNHRSYNQLCGLAYALDIVGERWTLLIVRELFAGPRRFTDLVEGLPGISTNLLTERLKHLEQQGLLRRRVLPPPAASMVYELTPLGLALEGALLELGKWGRQFVPASPEGATVLRLGSYALTLKTFFRPHLAQGINETYALHIDDEFLQVQIEDGAIHVQQNETRPADAAFYTDITSYLGLLLGEIPPDQAIASGLVRVEGNPAALCRFLMLCSVPPKTHSTANQQTITLPDCLSESF